MHVYIDDVDVHYGRAKAATATINAKLDERDYGDRRYHASDPEGHMWMFGDTRARAVA